MLNIPKPLNSSLPEKPKSPLVLQPEFAQVMYDGNLQSSWLKLSYFDFIYGVELLLDFHTTTKINDFGELQFSLDSEYANLALPCFNDAKKLLELHTELSLSLEVQKNYKYEPQLVELITQIKCDFEQELELVKSLAAAKVELTKVVTTSTVSHSTLDRFELMVRLLRENQFPQYMPFCRRLIDFFDNQKIKTTSQGISFECDTELIGERLDCLYRANCQVMGQYFAQKAIWMLT
jgi:hypothetical protein